MKKILIIGTGFLGSKICDVLSKEYKVVGTYFGNPKEGCRRLDITVAKDVKNLIGEEKPDIIIHTAAIADVKYCKDNSDEARKVNAEGTENIAKLCKDKKIRLFYPSTNVVFSGEDPPCTEDKEPDSIDVYGLSKLMGEVFVKKLADYCIIRMSMLYGYNSGIHKVIFGTQTLDALSQDKKIFINNYHIRYPTLIDDIAGAFLWLIKTDKKGIFHFSNNQAMTKYECILKAASALGYPHSNILPTNDKEINRPCKVELINTKKLDVKFTKIDKGLEIIKSQMETK